MPAEIMDKDLEDHLDRLDDFRSIWTKYRRPNHRTVAGFPLVKAFNETVGMDLKERSYSPKVWFLHLVDHAHAMVHNVSYTPKEKKKSSKGTFRFGYLFLVQLKVYF